MLLRNSLISDHAVNARQWCDQTRNLAPHQVFNANCFAPPSPGQNGTFRLPYIKGPGCQEENLAIHKSFSLGKESRSLEVRAEAFNFLNHPYYTIIQYDPLLYMGFTTYGGTANNPKVAGFLTNKTGNRIVQLGVKFYF